MDARLELAERVEGASGPWLCFFCGETMATREDAAEHFGEDPCFDKAACVTAFTEPVATIIADRREWRRRALEAETEVETLGFQLNNFEYTARKLTGRPSAGTSDLVMAWDSMEGRILATGERFWPSGFNCWFVSHLNMKDGDGYYLARDGKTHADYEIVQSADAAFENRPRVHSSTSASLRTLAQRGGENG